MESSGLLSAKLIQKVVWFGFLSEVPLLQNVLLRLVALQVEFLMLCPLQNASNIHQNKNL